MQTYARIQDGVVAELVTTEAPIATLFHPSVQFVAVSAPDAPRAVAVGWRHTVSGFQPPPAAPGGSLPGPAELHARIVELMAQVKTLLD